MSKPSVGRIVHFYADPDDPPLAAIITRVHSDTAVDLRVFQNNEYPPEFHTSVVNHEGAFKRWAWPPRVE